MVPAEFVTRAVTMLANGTPEALDLSNECRPVPSFDVFIHIQLRSVQQLLHNCPAVAEANLFAANYVERRPFSLSRLLLNTLSRDIKGHDRWKRAIGEVVLSDGRVLNQRTCAGRIRLVVPEI